MSARLEIAPGVFRDNNVVELASVERVDQAWQLYADKAAELVDNPHLLCDRGFNEELARRHERWKRVFLIQEAERCS